MKTLIFCTGYAPTLTQWESLYGKWINAVEAGQLSVDKILIVDDGSPALPSWTNDDEIVTLTDSVFPLIEPEARGVIYHYTQNLGRQAIYVYPGWYRSFMTAAAYAKQYGYQKIIHLESDAFLISGRMQQYVNDYNNGWTTMWCPKYRLAETAIQIIAGSNALDKLYNMIDIPYEQFAGRPADPNPAQGISWLPYNEINTNFNGDRWGENNTTPPLNADYACQISADTYCWWLD